MGQCEREEGADVFSILRIGEGRARGASTQFQHLDPKEFVICILYFVFRITDTKIQIQLNIKK